MSSNTVRVRFRPIPMAANSSVVLGDSGMHHIGGFLCQTSGTITVTANLAIGGPSPTLTTFVNAVPVTAGVWTPLPFVMQGPITVTLAGGAVGTLAV